MLADALALWVRVVIAGAAWLRRRAVRFERQGSCEIADLLLVSAQGAAELAARARRGDADSATVLHAVTETSERAKCKPIACICCARAVTLGPAGELVGVVVVSDTAKDIVASGICEACAAKDPAAKVASALGADRIDPRVGAAGARPKIEITQSAAHRRFRVNPAETLSSRGKHTRVADDIARRLFGRP
jgi:hypothetical protein